MKGNYMIYKLVKSTGEEETLFYLPENDEDRLRRMAYRLLELKQYKSNGYEVFGILYVDKETYLNARLDYRVKQYCQLDLDERKTREEKYKYNPEVYFQTMQMIQDMKWTALKTISMLVRRLIREDLDIHNEIGIQLYDQYCMATL
jgi:hypothetical protein